MTTSTPPDYTVNMESYDFRKKIGLLVSIANNIMSGAIYFADKPPSGDDKAEQLLLARLFNSTKLIIELQRAYIFDNHRVVTGEDKLFFNGYIEVLTAVCENWDSFKYQLKKLPERILGEFATGKMHAPLTTLEETIAGVPYVD